MNEILKIFFSLSVSGSIIALVLFALKPFIKSKLSKTWQYYIWLIVIIRLLLPFSVETNIVGQLFSEAEKIITAQNEVLEPINYIPITIDSFAPQSQAPQINHNETIQQEQTASYWNEIKSNLWLIWLGIAVMLLVRKITGYHSFVRYIKAGVSEVTDNKAIEIFKTTCIAAGLKKPLKIYTNPLAASAMLVGIYKPFVVVPDIEIGEVELRNIFIHELTHYKRMDAFYKWIAQLALCLHWYNPVVYLISREINKNCELSCDETIIRNLDGKGKRSYGDTLLSSLRFNGNYNNTIISITLNEDAKLLKERLEAIMKFNRKSKLTIAFSTVLTIIMISGAAVTGAYASAKSIPANKDKQEISITNSKDKVLNATGKENKNNSVDMLKEARALIGNDNQFLSDAWISYEGQGGSNIIIEFPDWYTKDMWDVKFIWGDYAVIPIEYDKLDDNNSTMLGVGHDTHYELKIGLPNKETLIIDLRELERNLKSNQASVNQKNDYTPEEADKRGIAIIDSSGTWGQEVDLLIPYMTQAGVDKIVSVYLERQLFPGITPPEGARRVAANLETALKHMSKNAKQAAENMISAYYDDKSDLSKLQTMPNDIPEYFTSGGIANTTQKSNTYTYEGVIGADNYQFGNPFPAKKGEQLTFKLNTLEYVTGEDMNEDDKSILRIVLGADNEKDNWAGFGLLPKSLKRIAASFPASKTANYHITILNYSGKEVKYSFTLTIK